MFHQIHHPSLDLEAWLDRLAPPFFFFILTAKREPVKIFFINYQSRIIRAERRQKISMHVSRSRGICGADYSAMVMMVDGLYAWNTENTVAPDSLRQYPLRRYGTVSYLLPVQYIKYQNNK